MAAGFGRRRVGVVPGATRRGGLYILSEDRVLRVRVEVSVQSPPRPELGNCCSVSLMLGFLFKGFDECSWFIISVRFVSIQFDLVSRLSNATVITFGDRIPRELSFLH